MIVACQVVQQEMDVEVVWMSRLWIICISQVSTTTRNKSFLKYRRIPKSFQVVLLLQECDKSLPQIVTLPMIVLSVYYLVK